jgi:hypothetical protein
MLSKEVINAYRTSFTVPMTPVIALPTPVHAPSDDIFIPFANNTKRDCYLLTTGNATELATCAAISKGSGTTISPSIKWNPSLRNKSPCVLEKNTTLHVGQKDAI